MHSDKLPITGPCPIDLDAIGFDRGATVAHCTHCIKSVTVLSNMTRGEAKQFLRENKGKKMCVSYARDGEGRIRFKPELEARTLVPVSRLARRVESAPVARLRARPGRTAGLVAALGMTAAMACTPHAETPVERNVVVQSAPEAEAESRVVEFPPKVVEPEAIPLAGAAVIPEEIMVDGEMEVPDPDALDVDAPCDKGAKAEPALAPKPGWDAKNDRSRPGMQVL